MMRDEETKSITAHLILEIIGRPPEHLTGTLNEIIGKIDEEKGVNVKTKNIKEPVTMKDREDFFTTFAEVEVEVEELIQLAILMFKYMPAHVEIISPEHLNIDNNTMGDIFSEISRRLHGYEEILRMMQVERNIMVKKLKGVTEESDEDIEEEPRTLAGTKKKRVKKK